MIPNHSKNKFIPLLFLVILIIGLFLREKAVFSNSFWLDEVITFEVSMSNTRDLIFQNNNYWDFAHPSFFYVLVKILRYFSENHLLLRNFSILFYFATAYFLYKFGKSLNGSSFAIMSVINFSVNPVFVNLGYQLRMYPLLFFLGVLSLYLLQKLFTKQSTALVLGTSIVLACAFYIDYAIVWLYLGIFFTYIILKIQRDHHTTDVLKIMIVTAVLIIPQLLIMFHNFDKALQLQSGIEKLNLQWVFTSGSLYSGIFLQSQQNFSAIVSWILFIISQLLIIREYRLKKNTSYVWLILLGLSFSIVCALILHLVLIPIYQPRNQIVTAIIPLIGSSILLTYLYKKRKKLWMFGLSLFLFYAIQSYRQVNFDTTINWTIIKEKILNGASPVFIGERKYLLIPLTVYYLPEKKNEVVFLTSADELAKLSFIHKKFIIFTDYNEADAAGKAAESEFCKYNECEIYSI